MHPRAPELKALPEKWASVVPAERTTSQQFLIEFCDALGVARPDAGRGDYSFEYPVQTTNRKTGVTTSNWIADSDTVTGFLSGYSKQDLSIRRSGHDDRILVRIFEPGPSQLADPDTVTGFLYGYSKQDHLNPPIRTR